MIRDIKSLCEHFGVDADEYWFQKLNRQLHEDTACGASISVYGTLSGDDAVEYHNGHRDPIPDSFKLTGFAIQTIVEGSDVDVRSDISGLPVSEEAVDDWIQYMEDEADVLRHEANDEPVPEPKDGSRFVVVLSDGETYSELQGCRIVEVPVEHLDDIEGFLRQHPTSGTDIEMLAAHCCVLPEDTELEDTEVSE